MRSEQQPGYASPGEHNLYCNTVLLNCWAFRHPMQFCSQLYANVSGSLPYGADG